MGVTKAGDDAMSVVTNIHNHGVNPEALLAYRADRLLKGQEIVARAQYLGRYMQSQVTKGKDNSEAMTRNADTVMKETAIDIANLATTL